VIALMRRAYGVLPWGFVALGMLHMAATFKLFDSVTTSALWFFNGGIVLVISGVLNLVNRRYGANAAGLRRFCQATNFVMLAFAIVSGLVSRGSTASLVVVLGLMGSVAVLSWLPNSYLPARP
jgi:hypothetical protein